jgi:esterase/lipase superfamily enzyme
LRVCEGIFFINLDIYENGIRVFCTDYHEDLKPLKDKLWDLLWTIRKDKQKKRVVGVFVQSLGNDLLYNILASLMINARKREETNRLYQRLDNLILQLG